MHASAPPTLKAKPTRDRSLEFSALDRAIGSLVIEALTREIMLAPKPGLVSPSDSGSHHDMDLPTFQRSLIALKDYFPTIAALGMAGADFPKLRECGLAAETQMLAATGGINTHLGAIFSMGLLAAAAGSVASKREDFSAKNICAWVAREYGPSILRHACVTTPSHDLDARHGSKLWGARAEAYAGFPTALQIGLPAYQFAMRKTGCPDLAAVHCLFTLISEVDDTNLLRRGGYAGVNFAKERGQSFLLRGGVLAVDWRASADAIHAEFVSRNLSPGGSADLLAVTLFLDSLQKLSDATRTFV
jgi:triphosphoribosyl-dephospho-CoA synthase